jgi:hypothetical protein
LPVKISYWQNAEDEKVGKSHFYPIFFMLTKVHIPYFLPYHGLLVEKLVDNVENSRPSSRFSCIFPFAT